MKSFILILTAFIFILVSKPGIELIFPVFLVKEQCQDICKSENQHESEKGTEKNCDGKLCNPFQVCCAAVLIYIDPLIDYLPQPLVFQKTTEYLYTPHILCINFDFWHPPKIV